MAYFAEVQLPRFREEDLPGTTKKLYNTVRELQEMLQFVLSNLDGDNIEGYEEIFNRLEGADGAISILKQTAEEISAQVRKGTDQIADLIVRADGITQRVQDTEKGIAEIKLTADGISQRVTDNEGNISSLKQTASGLSSQVAGIEGSISSVTQTSEEIRQAVYGTNGSGATTSVTANGLIYEVFGSNGKFSKLQQTVDGIDLTGAVTFHDLEEEGRTDINGANITTGKIALKRLELENDYGYITMGTGSTGHFSTRGIRVAGPPVDGSPDRYRNHLLATNAGIRIVGEDAFGYESIWLDGETIEATSSISTASDERVKNAITYDVAERYGAFYRALKPARYHMDTSRSGRFHTGFIAQQVRDALEAGGLGRCDLAALVQRDYDPEAEDGGGGQYSIRYDELIALNTAMVQQLLNRVDALEAEVQALKGGV